MDILKIILTSFFSVVVLFIITKLMGHKQLAQLDFFDYICGITIGSIAAEMATELETPLYPLIGMIVYGAVSILLNRTMQKFPRSRKYINGSPTILMAAGKLYRKNFKAAKLDLSEFSVMCREAGYFKLSDIHTAVFEPNGKLTVLPKSTARPLMPSDLGITPPKDAISTEIIMDGRALGENLTRLGYDDAWLRKRLSELGYKSAREVYYATVDESGSVDAYGIQ